MSDDESEKNGMNGSGLNGHKNAERDNRVIQFPTLADRDRLRKEKIAKEEAWRKEYKAKQKSQNPPFLNIPNIPLFVRIIIPALILIHIGIFLLFDESQIMNIYTIFGFIPAYYTSDLQWYALLGPFTHMLLHGSWMHLIFNTIMLAAMGTFFAREFGNTITTIFFILCGLGGALAFLLLNMGDRFPLIGASGAISGFFAVFLVLMQKRGAFSAFGNAKKYGILPLVGFWLVFMILIGQLNGGHAWEAHTGGFITGLLALSWLFRKDFKFWKI